MASTAKVAVSGGSTGKIGGNAPKQAPQVLVQVQTMRGTVGVKAQFAQVQAAIAAYNKAHKGTPHVAMLVTALAANTKGMQYQLALWATLARKHGATIVRLGVHNGEVAVCGPKAAVEAAIAAVTPTHNAIATACANTYNPAAHGNRVGFSNAWLCGVPAGMQSAWGIAPTLAYGLGYLFAFAAPGSGAAYAMGQSYGQANANALLGTGKPARIAKPRATKPSPAIEAVPTAPATPTADATITADAA